MQALIASMCPTVNGVFKTKSMQFKTPAGLEQQDFDEALVWIATLIGALLYARPYSSQSPALEACYQAQLNQAPTSTPKRTPPALTTFTCLRGHQSGGGQQTGEGLHCSP